MQTGLCWARGGDRYGDPSRRHCCPGDATSGARVHLPLGEHLRPSALPEGCVLPQRHHLSCQPGPRAPGSARTPTALRTEPVWLGHSPPEALSSRPPRCSPSSSGLRGPKSSSVQGPPLSRFHTLALGAARLELLDSCFLSGNMDRGLPPRLARGNTARNIQTVPRKMPRGGPRWVVQTDEVTVVDTRQAPEIPG